MPFFKNLLSVIGKGKEEQHSEILGLPETTSDSVSGEEKQTSGNSQFSGLCPEEVLNEIIRLVNHSLPDYIVASLDMEAERAYIYDRIKEPFRIYSEQLSGAIEAEKNKEVESLKGKVRDLENARRSIQESQSSAERQKRALAERVADYERRLMDSEAEREQLSLECRGLLNKLKVADMQRDSDDRSAELIESLQAELVQLRQTVAQQAESLTAEADKQAEADTLQAALEEKTTRITELSGQLEQSRSDAGQLQEELVTLRSAYQEMELRLREQEEQVQALQEFVSRCQILETENERLEQECRRLSEKNVLEVELPADVPSVPHPETEHPQEETVSEPVEETPSVSEDKKEEAAQEAVEHISEVKRKPAKKKKKEPEGEERTKRKRQSGSKKKSPYADNGWLVPTRPDTPEEIARRKAEERRRKKEEAERSEQKHTEEIDKSQMTLW